MNINSFYIFRYVFYFALYLSFIELIVSSYVSFLFIIINGVEYRNIILAFIHNVTHIKNNTEYE